MSIEENLDLKTQLFDMPPTPLELVGSDPSAASSYSVIGFYSFLIVGPGFS